jgi:SsrA-binding protein
MAREGGKKLIAANKNARREYEIMETFEAGLALTGSEVKSLREGKVSFQEGYVRVSGGEAFLTGVHIAPYSHAGYAQHDPARERKLLMHKREIEYLGQKVEQKGLTLVPLRLYFANSRVKLELGLGRGKKLHDKRQDLKAKDIERETAREMSKYR